MHMLNNMYEIPDLKFNLFKTIIYWIGYFLFLYNNIYVYYITCILHTHTFHIFDNFDLIFHLYNF